MIWRIGSLFAEGPTVSAYPGYGILFENLPATGENGASPLLNDGGVNGDEIRWELVGVGGDLTVVKFYEDCSAHTQGIGYYDYEGFINNESSGVFRSTVNSASPTVQSTINASIPKPTASASISITPAPIQSAIAASIPKPTISALINIASVGDVSCVISASIPKPTVSASINVQSAPVSVTISASIPKPVASIQMFTGNQVIPDWYESINQMIEDGRYIVIESASRHITLNS